MPARAALAAQVPVEGSAPRSRPMRSGCRNRRRLRPRYRNMMERHSAASPNSQWPDHPSGSGQHEALGRALTRTRSDAAPALQHCSTRTLHMRAPMAPSMIIRHRARKVRTAWDQGHLSENGQPSPPPRLPVRLLRFGPATSTDRTKHRMWRPPPPPSPFRSRSRLPGGPPRSRRGRHPPICSYKEPSSHVPVRSRIETRGFEDLRVVRRG